MNAEQTTIIARLDAQWESIAALQEHYLKYWGNYFQGLASHDHLPNGVVVERVDTEAKPSDQDATYQDFWRGKYWELEGEPGEEVRVIKYLYSAEAIEPVEHLSTRVEMHISDGPQGKTWRITLEYEDATQEHWRYARDKAGNETPWHIVSDEEQQP